MELAVLQVKEKVNLREFARNVASFKKIKNIAPVYKTVDKNKNFDGKVALVSWWYWRHRKDHMSKTG